MKTLNQRTAEFTGITLLAAFLAAQLLTIDGVLADSYSVDILTGEHGNLIANQLMNGNNTVAEIMPNVPNGTKVWLWDCATRDYIYVGSFLDGAWVGENTNLSLAPGSGIALWSPVAFTLTSPASGSLRPSHVCSLQVFGTC